MKKKQFISILLALFLILLSACNNDKENTNNENETTTPTSKSELTIGILPAESAIPIILAKENGLFDKEGVEVTIKSFSAPTDRNVAIQAKELDATIADVMTEAAFKENGISMKITSDINEDFKILSSPDSGITSIEQLADKNVSLVPNFILEYIMDDFAKQNNFEYGIVEIPSFSGRAEALIANQIDGVVFTEPQASMLVSQGAHLLASSQEAGIKGGAILFTEELINTNGEAVSAFYRAYNKAIDYMNETDADAYGDILSEYQFPEAMSKYLSNKKGTFTHAQDLDEQQVIDIVQWSKNKNMIQTDYTYEDLTNFTFIP